MKVRHNLSIILLFLVCLQVYMNNVSDMHSSESSTVMGNYYDIPLSLNWATMDNPIGQPVVPPVMNQGFCGSCWAVVATESISASIRINTGRSVRLSMQELVDCDTSNKGCMGGDPRLAFHYAISHGINEYEDYKYEQRQGSCRSRADLPKAFIRGMIPITAGDDYNLKMSLALVGPVATGICGTDPSFMYYQSGIFDDANCCKDQNHAVLLTGYGHDDRLGVDYWIVQNSWGEYWGENGFARILRSPQFPSICGFDTFPSLPYGGYMMHDNNVTDDNYQEVNKRYSVFDRIVEWFNVNIYSGILSFEDDWKSLLALVSSLLLTMSVLLLLYGFYLDRLIDEYVDRNLVVNNSYESLQTNNQIFSMEFSEETEV